MFVTLLKYIWKKKWMLFFLSAITASLFLAYACYNTYLTENIRISLIYPNSEKGYYPDGSRFDMYDIISDDVLDATVKEYNEATGTSVLTLEDAKKGTAVNYYLAGAVQERVQNALNSGQDYSYFTNEYIVSFRPVRRIDFNRPDKWFGLKPEINTALYMEKLYKNYSMYFMNAHTEMNTISKITQNISGEDYDYIELTDMYGKKISMYINYLTSKSTEDQTFRSQSTGVSFNDLVTGFQSLKDIKLQNLISFVSSSRIAKNVTDIINNYKTRIEKGTLAYSRLQDESDVASKAMKQYDHTFDANIVIVGMNDELGLYQSRPRTAFDKITKRSLDTGVKAKDTKNDVDEYQRLIEEYSSDTTPPEEKERLFKVADGMIADIEKEYNGLIDQSNKTVDDYLAYKCSNFINSVTIPKSYTDTSVIIKTGVVFCGTVVLLLLLLLLMDKKNPFASKRRPRVKKQKASNRRQTDANLSV